MVSMHPWEEMLAERTDWMQRQQNAKRQAEQKYALRQCFINHAYPPSTTSLTELKPINLSDLRLETRHHGKALFIRSFYMMSYGTIEGFGERYGL